VVDLLPLLYYKFTAESEIARTCSKLVADRFKAKFHYAIWFEAGSKLVADTHWQTGSKLVADLSQTC